MGVDEIRQFLTYLAVKKNVAASTQNVNFNAILFLYKQVWRADDTNLYARFEKQILRQKPSGYLEQTSFLDLQISFQKTRREWVGGDIQRETAEGFD